MKPTGYALFDLDQTLVPWDMQLLYANWVFHHYPLRRLYLILFFLAVPFIKLLSTRNVKRTFLSILHRLPQAELERLNHTFVEHYSPALFYPEVVALLEEHKAQGHLVILTSASPSLYVKKIGEKLGVDHTFCTEVIIPERMPLIPTLHGDNNKGDVKIQKLTTWFQEKGHQVTSPLPNSTAYTDSTADLPLIEHTEQAYLIHPSDTLRHETEQRKKPYTVLTPERPFQTKKGKIFYAIQMFLGVYPL